MPTPIEIIDLYQAEIDRLDHSRQINKDYQGEAGQHVESETLKQRCIQADLLAKEVGI